VVVIGTQWIAQDQAEVDVADERAEAPVGEAAERVRASRRSPSAAR
jgi:hypothetical protein